MKHLYVISINNILILVLNGVIQRLLVRSRFLSAISFLFLVWPDEFLLCTPTKTTFVHELSQHPTRFDRTIADVWCKPGKYSFVHVCALRVGTQEKGCIWNEMKKHFCCHNWVTRKPISRKKNTLINCHSETYVLSMDRKTTTTKPIY